MCLSDSSAESQAQRNPHASTHYSIISAFQLCVFVLRLRPPGSRLEVGGVWAFNPVEAGSETVALLPI